MNVVLFQNLNYKLNQKKNVNFTKDIVIVQIQKKPSDDSSYLEQEHEEQEPNEVSDGGL